MMCGEEVRGIPWVFKKEVKKRNARKKRNTRSEFCVHESGANEYTHKFLVSILLKNALPIKNCQPLGQTTFSSPWKDALHRFERQGVVKASREENRNASR